MRSTYSADHISFQHVEPWQQYTGLKDKNGKEIYEGDIVEINGDRSRIGWDSQFAGFYLEDLDGLLDLDEPWLFVVIGNIHENPELLESP